MTNQHFLVAIKATEKAITAEKAKLQRVLADVAMVLNTAEFIAKCRELAISIGESEDLHQQKRGGYRLSPLDFL